MAQKIQMRRDSVENWLDVNPILARGEWGVAFDGTSTDVIAIKIGDGESDWESLQSLLPIVVGYIAESRLDDETGFNAYDGEGALSVVLWADLESGVTVFVRNSGRVCTADGAGSYTTVDAPAGDYQTEDGVVARMPEVGTPSILSPTSSGGAVDSVNGQTGVVVLTAADVSGLDENTRDVIGAALVAGSGVAVTVDDPGNTITIAVSGVVADAINDGTTTVAPSQNAVFDALAAKIANPGGSNDDFLQRKAGVYTNRTIAQVKTDLGVVAETLPASIVEAKGDLIVGTAADTAARLAVGTSGTFAMADPSATSGIAWALVGAGPDNLARPYIAGNFYGPIRGNSGTASSTGGYVRCIPFIPTHNFTADRILLYSTTAAGGAKARLGIYDSDGTNSLPKTLLLDAGEVALDVAAGDRLATISYSFTAGRLYWLAENHSGSYTFAHHSESSNYSLTSNWGIGGGIGSPAPMAVAAQTQTYGALPSSLTGDIAYYNNNNQWPYMMVRGS